MNDTRADKYDEKLILSNIVIDQNKQILLCSLSMISWKQKWGVCWWVVRVVDIESFAPHWFGFKSHQGLRILSCEEAIQLTYKTSVVLLRDWNNASPKGTQGLPARMTFTVLVQRKTQPKKKKWKHKIITIEANLIFFLRKLTCNFLNCKNIIWPKLSIIRQLL